MSDTTIPQNTTSATPQVPKQATPPAQESLPSAPPARWYRRPYVAPLALAAIVAAVVIVWTLLPGTFALKGSITLTAAGSTASGTGGCQGSGGYSDMHQGATVTVYNASGQTVAMTPLQAGATQTTSSTAYPYYTSACKFAFEANDVPDDSSNYTVEIGNRGKMTYSADAAKAGQIALSLGN